MGDLKAQNTGESIRPIRTEADLDAALIEIERLWEAPEESAEADRMEVLSILVEEFERRNYSFSAFP